jgi:hypothetical protein
MIDDHGVPSLGESGKGLAERGVLNVESECRMQNKLLGSQPHLMNQYQHHNSGGEWT